MKLQEVGKWFKSHRKEIDAGRATQIAAFKQYDRKNEAADKIFGVVILAILIATFVFAGLFTVYALPWCAVVASWCMGVWVVLSLGWFFWFVQRYFAFATYGAAK